MRYVKAGLAATLKWLAIAVDVVTSATSGGPAYVTDLFTKTDEASDDSDSTLDEHTGEEITGEGPA